MSRTVEEIRKRKDRRIRILKTAPALFNIQDGAEAHDDCTALLAMLDAQVPTEMDWLIDTIAHCTTGHFDDLMFRSAYSRRKLATLSPVGTVAGRERAACIRYLEAQPDPHYKAAADLLRDLPIGALPPPDAGQPGAVSGAENAAGGVVGSADEGRPPQ